MKERTTQALFAYWNEVRNGRVAPRRFEIEPSRIAGILPETFILERQSRAEYVFRLAGTRVCECFGREFRGRNLLDLWNEEDREVMVRVLESITREGPVGHVVFTATDEQEHQLEFEMLLLPLVHSGQEISRVLGSMCSSEAPLWLGSAALERLAIRSFKLIWPDGRPHAVIARLDHGAPFVRMAAGKGQPRIVRSEGRKFRVYDGGVKDGVETD